MRHKNALTATDRIFDAPRRLFTVAEANKALVLVRRIVQDVVRQSAELRELRARRDELATLSGTVDQVEALGLRIDEHMEAIYRLRDELNEIGCELKDYETGLIDFPALLTGRTVLLCWRLGENEITHWHEIDAGFSGRRAIDENFHE